MVVVAISPYDRKEFADLKKWWSTVFQWDFSALVAFIVLALMFCFGGIGLLVIAPVFVFKVIFQRCLLKPLWQLLQSLENPEQKAEILQRLKGEDGLRVALLRGLDPNLALTFGERAQVIELVGHLRLKEAADPLIKLLKEFPMWEEIHAKAIWALGEIGDESAAPELVSYLGEFNYLSIRMAAVETLHKLGWGEFVDAFNRLMVGNEEALTVLREKYRQETIKALTRALWANKPSVAITAANALGRLNAIEALKELKRRCSPIQSPKEVRQVCREVVAKLEQFSRLPSPARPEIDIANLPRPADPSAFQTETLPSPAKPPDERSL